MEWLKNKFEKYKRGPQDVVGIDLQPKGVAAVRVLQRNHGAVVQAVDMLPPVRWGERDAAPSRLAIPSRLKAKHACLCVPGDQSVVKLVSIPGAVNARQESEMIQGLGLADPDQYRIAYKVVSEGRGKTESKVLLAALPEAEAVKVPRCLPSGLPAPFSMEISDLAALSALACGPGLHRDDGEGLLRFGDESSTLALFHKGKLALVRSFSVGAAALLAKVKGRFGVDEETAAGMISDGAFDISQAVESAIAPLVKQLTVSRDFVERRENCKIRSFRLSGDLCRCQDVVDLMQAELAIKMKVWNPFEGIEVEPGALTDDMAGSEWRWAAALGAGLATFEET